MNRKPVIAANWKMYKSREETRQTCSELVTLVGGWGKAEVVVCVPFTSLDVAREVLHGKGIGLGAQNLHWADEGAYTSQISLPMLVDSGCDYVIIGHSECREYLAETDETVNLKVRKVLTSKLTPVVCVGESIQTRQANQATQFVQGQLERGLAGLTAEEASRIIIAYEPIWAIGTGHTATPEQAQEVHEMIRSWLVGQFGSEVGNGIRILYGGSVKPANIAILMAQSDIDGALVGGASLAAESFAKIVKY